jgi:hypothetical protein
MQRGPEEIVVSVAVAARVVGLRSGTKTSTDKIIQAAMEPATALGMAIAILRDQRAAMYTRKVIAMVVVPRMANAVGMDSRKAIVTALDQREMGAALQQLKH